MSQDQYLVIVYGLFWIVRINGCVRRGRQPLLRGPEWFFSVRVPPAFYTGAGRRLLRQYWMRMLWPFAVDIPLAIAIFASGRIVLLNGLILGLCALIHVNHVYSVNLAERQARAFAVAGSEQPVARMVLSLTPRRLRDYTNARLEWAIALSFAIAAAWLIRVYAASPAPRSLRLVFGGPVLLLYGQVGMLFVKRLVLAWRSPVPHDQAAEHLAVAEQTRRYYLRTCDRYRVAMAAAVLFRPIELSLPLGRVEAITNIWFAAWIVITVIGAVRVEITRKRLVALAVRARPARLPDFLHESEIARWPVCFEPSAPMLVLKGARGYSLNLANRLAQAGAAYLAGFALLIVALHAP